MFLKHLRESLRLTPVHWATYSIAYFLVGTGMNQAGQWIQVACFNHWWQVIIVYVIYMVPVSVVLRCLPWWKQYLYGLLPMGLLELGGYAMRTSYAYPGNILDRVLGERDFSLAMTLFFAAYFPILNSLVALIRRVLAPASPGVGAAPPP